MQAILDRVLAHPQGQTPQSTPPPDSELQTGKLPDPPLFDGKALTLISPRLDPGSQHVYQTVSELYNHLYELYGDPNKERNARPVFKDLAMKKADTFQEFYAEFLRCVADSNISPRDLKEELNDKLA